MSDTNRRRQRDEIVTLAFANDPLWSRAMARPDGKTEMSFQQADRLGELLDGSRQSVDDPI